MATRHRTPARLNALIAQDPDLVDRIFEYLLAEFPQLAGAKFAEAKEAVRDEFAGQEAYIPQRAPSARQQLAQQVLSLFNGRNATEVARRLQISRATVYRILKQEGGQKKASQVSGN
jgi:Mor family transcriptional regulator